MRTLLQINAALNSGSTGKISEQIGLLVQKEGWNSYIAHGSRYKNQSKLHTVQVGSKFDECIHGFWNSLLLDNHGLGSKNVTKHLISMISDEIKPNIIHLHNIHGYFINYPLLFEFISKNNIPVVWTLHDCWPFTGHCAYYMMHGCTKWQEECKDCELLNTYPKSLFRDRSTQNFRLKKKLFTSVPNLTMVPVSNWLHREVEKSFLKDKTIQTIHNGIDLEIFRPSETIKFRKQHNLEKKTLLLGVASPWNLRKGLQDFIALRKELSDNYVIILVGLSPKQISALPQGIVGIEKTENVKELAQIYSECDMFINPTYEDNYPTVNLEAIACGTPVITYDTGGSSEAVNSQTGLVVPCGDIPTLVNSLKLLESRDRISIKKECRDYAVKHFNNRDCFMEYLRLYKRILEE